MSNDEVTRLRTRKTCKVPPAFVLLKERARGRRERGKQRGELSILPTRTGILRILHVSGLSTHWQREHTAISGRPDNHSKPTSTFRRTIPNSSQRIRFHPDDHGALDPTCSS